MATPNNAGKDNEKANAADTPESVDTPTEQEAPRSRKAADKALVQGDNGTWTEVPSKVQ